MTKSTKATPAVTIENAAPVENETATVAQPSGTVAGTASTFNGNYAVGTSVNEAGFTVTHR
jgi:hypothetical protein